MPDNERDADQTPRPEAEIGLYFAFFTEVGIISQLSRAMMESQLPRDMTVQHFSVVNHLIRRGNGETPLQLANAFQVPKTSMSHTLAGLEKRGMIEMRPNPKDGRSKCVYLLDPGRAFLGEAMQAVAKEFAGLRDMLPPERLAKLTPDLAEIRAKLDAARD